MRWGFWAAVRQPPCFLCFPSVSHLLIACFLLLPFTSSCFSLLLPASYLPPPAFSLLPHSFPYVLLPSSLPPASFCSLCFPLLPLLRPISPTNCFFLLLSPITAAFFSLLFLSSASLCFCLLSPLTLAFPAPPASLCFLLFTPSRPYFFLLLLHISLCIPFSLLSPAPRVLNVLMRSADF